MSFEGSPFRKCLHFSNLVDAVKKHKKTYDDDDDDADEDSLGTAAAIQALKLFNKGETGQKQSQGAFIGLALSEASKVSSTLHIPRFVAIQCNRIIVF